MELDQAVTALAALAQPARLKIFRYLVRVGASGVCAGDLAEEFELPKPTLSFHLKELVPKASITVLQNRRETSRHP